MIDIAELEPQQFGSVAALFEVVRAASGAGDIGARNSAMRAAR
jgi:hypothetical protein